MLRILCSLLATFAALAAADIELVLSDKSRVRGPLVSEDEQEVVIDATELKRGKVVASRQAIGHARIAERTELRPVEIELPERTARLDGSAAGEFRHAGWLLDRCRADLAVPHIRSGLDLDPESEWGARLMAQAGLTKVDGAWIDEAEHLKATGQVRIGSTITTATAAAIQRRLTIAQREKDTLTTRLAAAKALAAQKAPDANAITQRVATLARAKEAAERSAARVETQARQDGTVTAAEVNQINAARANITTAQGELTKAQKEQADATALAQRIATATQEQAALEASLATATRSVEALTAELAAAQGR